MRFDIVSIFPDFFTGPLDYGIVRRARETRLMDVQVHDLRAFTHDRHRTVDDRPFGGGEGMVLKPEPLFEAVEALQGLNSLPQASTAVVLLSASGRLFRQSAAREFSRMERIILLCGRYEGVDERVAEHLATHELSIGDFVLSGGELAAALVLDAVTRLIPGALGNEDSSLYESFSATPATGAMPAKPSIVAGNVTASIAGKVAASISGSVAADAPPDPSPLLLDYPHYTRPADFRGWQAPEVLLGGNHEEIRMWRQAKALEKTRRNRPDLLAGNQQTTRHPI